MLLASPGSGSGSSDHLPLAAKKASTEESRIELNVDSLQIILYFIYRTIFSFQSAQGSCVLASFYSIYMKTSVILNGWP